MKTSYLLHTLLFSIYPVLFLYVTNINSTLFLTTLYPISISIGAAVFFCIIVRLITKDIIKSCIITTIAIILFYSFGHVFLVCHSFLLSIDFDVANFKNTMLFIWLLQISLCIYWILIFYCGSRRISNMKRETCIIITKLLNIVALALVFSAIVSIIIPAYFDYDPTEHTSQFLFEQPINAGTVAELGYKPDIYYIILDGYARQDTLVNFYNFDNSDFINFLRSKGFYIAPRSKSNYFWTGLSLGSSLNMQYITFLENSQDPMSKDKSKLFRIVRDNIVARFLKNMGYKYIHFNSTWGPTMANPYADRTYSGSGGIFQEEFYRVLLETSLLRLLNFIVAEDLATYHLSNFKTLETIGSLEGPKFVFAHFVLPHHPYLFDQNGSVLRHATISNQMEFQKNLWGKKDMYVDQMIFLNKKIKCVVDGIFKHSANPPIIIIQSDHGPQLLRSDNKPHKNYIHTRFCNFSSAFTPGIKKELFPPDITPVNLFRIIFTNYFGTNFELLENRYFLSPFEHQYLFKEIMDPLNHD